MFVIISIALVIMAGLSLTYSVEASYYDSFKRRIENGFRNWGLKQEPTQADVLEYFSDRNVRHLTFGITEYKTFSIVNKNTNEILFSNKRPVLGDELGLIDEFLLSQNYLAALANEIGDNNRFLRLADKVYFDYAISKGDFVFYFRYDREDFEATVAEFNRIIQISLLLAISLSIALGIFLSKTITRPIEDLMYRARRIATGDFGEVLEIRSDDEIGKLTSAFNYMSRRLKNTLSQIHKEKSKVETILKNLKDGVIAFNYKGEIIHANLVAKMILGVRSIELNFDEFSQKFGINMSLKDFKMGEIASNSYVDVNIDERIIKMYFAFFTDIDKNIEGIICVMHDVTEEKHLEEKQREFVANVSHELKTPLASVKSYTETVLDGVDEQTMQKFLGIVNTEADRMARIVTELLELSRIDSKRMNLSFQKIDIKDLIVSIVDKMSLNLKEKDINLTLDLVEEAILINGDSHKIEQLFVNILSNAVKYTSEKGCIKIKVGILDANVFVRVEDTGIGIPKQALPRIFDRFYRVDKARSRQMGGTGLGLSIAKEIVQMHGGNITAASQVNEGTEILVTFPEG